MDLDLDLDLRIVDLDLDLDFTVAGLVTSLQQLPPHQLGDLGERFELPQRVLDGTPTAQRFSTIFRTQRGLS